MAKAEEIAINEAEMIAKTTAKSLLDVMVVLIQIRDGAGTTVKKAYAEAKKVREEVTRLSASDGAKDRIREMKSRV